MRVAVVGARRAAQGIGEHLARFFVQAGHDVCALLGTTPATAAEAVETLRRSTGHVAQPYVDFDALLGEEHPEILVVASPQETHAAYLRRACALGLHTLCEKPVVWGGTDPAGEAESIARAFLEAGLHLRINAQWPFTLPTYRALFPEVLTHAPSRFWMRLSPSSTGSDMLPAALPHALSLLEAVLPGPAATLVAIRVSFRPPDADTGRVEFVYRSSGAAVECRVDLARCPEPPRPAAYGFDGAVAHRRVKEDPLELAFEADGRTLPLPDPTPILVGDFLDAVTGGRPARIDAAVVPGMRHLAAIAAAAR